MRRRRLAIDAFVLVLYLATTTPALTGVPAHEWLGLGVAVAFAVHIAVNGDLVVGMVKSSCKRSRFASSNKGLGSGETTAEDGFPRPDRTRRHARVGNLILDASTFVVLAICVVSGLFISGDVLRVFGLYAPGYFVWDPLHAISAKVLLALIVVHVAVHARQLAGQVRHMRRTVNQK